MQLQKQQKQMAIFAVIVLLIGVAGFYAINHTGKPAKAPEQPVPVIDITKIDADFQVFLDDLLKEVEGKMKDYRTERKVLVETTGPMNLRDASYVEENFNMVNQLLPSLRARIDEITNIFIKAEADVAKMSEGQSPEAQKLILEKWNVLKQSQGKLYTDYFGIERTILVAYEELMKFYYEKRNDFTYDTPTNKLVFKNPDDQKQAERMQQGIAELYAQEKILLGKDEPEEALPAVVPQAEQPAAAETPVEQPPAAEVPAGAPAEQPAP